MREAGRRSTTAVPDLPPALAAPLDSIQGIPPHVKAKIPVTTARDYHVLPIQLRDEGKTLVVAMVDPQNVEQIDALAQRVPSKAGAGGAKRN